MLVGIGVVYRSQFSRWIGVIAAAIGGFSAMPWLPYFPIWTLIYITLAVLVIYGLLAHGARETAPSV